MNLLEDRQDEKREAKREKMKNSRVRASWWSDLQERSSATSRENKHLAKPSMLIRSRKSVTQSGLREPRSRLSGRGLNKYRFDVSRRGGVSFLAKRNDAPDYTSRSRTCVRCRALLRENRSISRQRRRRRLSSIYAYVQIFLPLDSRTKGRGEGRKD